MGNKVSGFGINSPAKAAFSRSVDNERLRNLLCENETSTAIDLAVDVMLAIESPTVVADNQVMIVKANDRFLALTGFSAKDLEGKNVKMLIFDSNTRANHDSYLTRYFETGEAKIIGSQGRNVNLKTKAGRSVRALFTLNRTSFQGKALFVACFSEVASVNSHNNVMMLEEIPRTVREVEVFVSSYEDDMHLLRDFISKAPLPLACYNEGILVYANNEMKKLMEGVETLELERANFVEEGERRLPNGKMVSIKMSCFGNYVVQSYTDITLLKEEQMRETEQWQSKLIELKHAKAVVEAVSNANKEFAGYIFHEIRVPLNAISIGLNECHSEVTSSIGQLQKKNSNQPFTEKDQLDAGGTLLNLEDAPSSTEAVRSNGDSDNNGNKDDANFNAEGKLLRSLYEQKDLLHMMQDASADITRVLDDALSLQKLEQGKFQYEFKPLHLLELHKTVVQRYKPLCQSKSITLVDAVDISSGAEVGVGDCFRLIQVISNLMSNALKFSHAGSHIWLRTTSIPSPHSSDELRVKIEVQDEGCGITAADAKKIFKPYVQINPGKAQGGGGTGLGLCIAKEFVAKHNGNLSLESSQPTAGCLFKVDLNLKKASVETIEKHLEKMTSDTRKVEPVSVTANENIDVLMVDDSDMSRKMLGRLLSRKNISFKEASNGRQALHILEHSSFNLILMDKEMPELDGYETTKEIRKTNMKVPIIGLTGNVLEEQMLEFRQCGADEILAKPLDPKWLDEVLIRYGIVG
jgi:PAS domain S-box-containing protein